MVDRGGTKKHNGRMRQGQALLMVLLVLGVAVTVGLSVVSRSITDVNLSGTEDQSAKALQAAEAGVEKALGGVYPGGMGQAVVETGKSNFDVKTVDLGSTTNVYKVPYTLAAGDVATINLQGYKHKFSLCWGEGGVNPAIEVILYFKRGSTWMVGRAGYDSDSSRRSQNGFANPGGGGNCSGYANYEQLKLNNTFDDFGFSSGDEPMFLRVRMLYNNVAQSLTIDPQGNGQNLPPQGKDITSVGMAGDTAQKVHVTQPDADLPFMFDTALFSGGNLSQ